MVTADAVGQAGLLLATTETYDVIIVDRMLPELDGLTLIKSVRGADIATPMLTVTGRSMESSVVPQPADSICARRRSALKPKPRNRNN